MDKILIVVESPTKVKTLKKFLGNRYKIASSVGHIRDLPRKKFGIDLENDCAPQYENLEEKREVIAKLQAEAKRCSAVYLCPDPDREGEAIAWHIASILPEGISIQRIAFNAMTKETVLAALKHPRNIDLSLVDAQQARRLLDRIVGYKISPLLQKRIKRGHSKALSAGRVQSIALKLVVDREEEIERFEPTEYWNIYATLCKKGDERDFQAALFAIEGKKLERTPIAGKEVCTIPNRIRADQLVHKLKEAQYRVSRVDKREKARHPVPPFITSTLQQEASRHYGFSPARTMQIAQSLYEGIDLGKEGTEGIITYMRTDSVRVEPGFLEMARAHIEKRYGKEYLPPKPRQYKAKKSTQDAHEAIRPTNMEHPPNLIERALTADQHKLYLLIWQRFVASQMRSATYNTVTCDIQTDQNMLLRATGSTVTFKGFLTVYEEKEDLSKGEESPERNRAPLPDLQEGQILDLVEVSPNQSFTKPPPRYTEASLVKELEKLDIGRPSTYAAIMYTIHNREYTQRERLTLKPTDLGKIIAQMLETHFGMIMDIAFTARMENALDEIAESKKEWKTFIKTFWEQFKPILEKAEQEAFVPKITTDINCPKCGHKLQKIWSRDKYFYGCSDYPNCTFTVPIEALEFRKEDYAEDFDWDQVCPKCSSPMKIAFSRFGAFLGCSRYPDCKGTISIPKRGEVLIENLPDCPAVGCDGKIQNRKNRWGKPFFSCSNYPDCDVIVNHLEELTSKYVDHPKTPYEKKAKGKNPAKKKSARKNALYSLSPELADVAETEHASRGEVLKRIWSYIKKHRLQDPKNKRRIRPDEKLAKIFGKEEPIDMFELPGILSAHIDKKSSKSRLPL